MGTDLLRARTTPLLATSTNTTGTGSHPSVPFPNERYQPASPMIKKREHPYGRDDPYSADPYRRDVPKREAQDREMRERERRREAEKRETEKREAEAKAKADEARAARDKDPDPKKREHTRPPTVIVDREKGASYRRIGFLGEGGFARVYEVVDDEHDHKAVKVVNKSNIKTKRNKTKLWAEIKLHQMLKHPNIVRFDECFEDGENVYMVLELCDHGSLMDLLRRRKRYTEAEARFYLVQLIGACQYMQDTNVIHRDLKLGNLFLDRNMNVKVGDFGLAALIENPGDRKKTICGTPNYIAPEVLFDTANGHSFEVDVWSVGVILYTLLIGKPPFQTKEVKAIYRRIRENRYEFPEDKEISASAQNLIMSILNTDPQERPTLEEILQHQWFLDGPFPSHVPVSSNDSSPDFSHITAAQSRRNFDNVHRRATGQPESTTPPHPPRADALGPSILAQERDFKAAVQPGSPISALLNSARQPLVQAPAGTRNSTLLRKLTEAGAASTLSPVRRGTAVRVPAAVAGPGPSSRPPVMDNVAEDVEEEEDEGVDPGPATPRRPGRDRELAQQKARIVSEMARLRIAESDKGSDKEDPRKALGEAMLQQPSSSLPVLKLPTRGNGYDRLEHNLTEALTAYKSHGGCRIPDGVSVEPPKVFVVSWLDYCAKYGMGFTMSDGTVSVHFNDSSSLALAPAKKHAEYIDGRRRDWFAMSTAPEGLTNKIFLLHKFEGYMLARLCGTYEYTWEDAERKRDLVYVEKYLRTKNVILFRLSNGILQFNFYDHTKLILSSDGLVVTIIDKNYVRHCWTLASILQPQGDGERERAKLDRYVTKLEYARSLLARMRAHGGMGATAARVQEKERERERDREPRERERERERETRQPIRG
ncbi:hypothetical protein CspHIS471_0403570 [Cutaneotrichosporon sp. HIS471]|nr:hypothetical protein CspHIS471_0403570 [Cutaneotrichosporon sp. HIS471]